jgi:hypothetical protein
MLPNHCGLEITCKSAILLISVLQLLNDQNEYASAVVPQVGTPRSRLRSENHQAVRGFPLVR